LLGVHAGVNNGLAVCVHLPQRPGCEYLELAGIGHPLKGFGGSHQVVPSINRIDRTGYYVPRQTSSLDAVSDDPRSGADAKQANGLRGWRITPVAGFSARA
jgi:hypothetical protein